MVRLSDVVRGVAGYLTDAPPPAAPAPAPARAEPARPDPAAAPRPTAWPRAPEPRPAPGGEAERLFVELQQFLAALRPLTERGGTFPWDALRRLVERVIAALDAGGDLFWVANRATVPPDAEYLAVHQARVAVLATRLGAVLGYEGERRVELGMAGCLIDVGLWRERELLARLDALTPEELARYRAHPERGAELVRAWRPPSDALVEGVRQHHEREQGQGYPRGLRGPAIHPDAKVLGLVDTYAGLTVPPTRRGLRPHEAVRELVRTRGEAFPPAYVKALLAEISIFPPGTLVRLSTGAVARVVAVNRNQPLRPRVEVVAAPGHAAGTPRLLDLAEAPFLYITGAVEDAAGGA